MEAGELVKLADELGATLAAVVFLALFVIPKWWQSRQEPHDAVSIAKLRWDIDELRKDVDDHKDRIDALEKRRRS